MGDAVKKYGKISIFEFLLSPYRIPSPYPEDQNVTKKINKK